MKTIGDFETLNPGETAIWAIDFTNRLAGGESVVSSSWACTVLTGTDDAPDTRIIGAAQTAENVSTQEVGNFLAPVLYALAATAITTTGRAIIMWANQSVVPIGQVA